MSGGIRDRSLYISRGQSRCANYRNRDNDRSPALYRAARSRIAWRNARHRSREKFHQLLNWYGGGCWSFTFVPPYTLSKSSSDNAAGLSSVASLISRLTFFSCSCLLIVVPPFLSFKAASTLPFFTQGREKVKSVVRCWLGAGPFCYGTVLRCQIQKQIPLSPPFKRGGVNLS